MTPIDPLLAIHAAATWALVGLIWVIQRVHYPLFAKVGEKGFGDYVVEHLWQITWIVMPLVAVEFATAALLLWKGFRDPWFLASLLPLLVNWMTTAIIEVPLHLRLARGFDAELLRKLIAGNWWRTLGWTVRGICILLVMI